MILNQLKSFVRYASRTARITPIFQIFQQLQRDGFASKTMHALELFGCDGEHHTRDIAAAVGQLTIWEYASHYEPILKRRFPQATVKITDSYQELANTAQKFDVVIADNHIGQVGGHYEHFDIFPAVFDVLADRAVIITNVVPLVDSADSDWLARRRAFYSAEDGASITFAEMSRTYGQLASSYGWRPERIYYKRRWRFNITDSPFYYCVIQLRCKHRTRKITGGLSDDTVSDGTIYSGIN